MSGRVSSGCCGAGLEHLLLLLIVAVAKCTLTTAGVTQLAECAPLKRDAPGLSPGTGFPFASAAVAVTTTCLVYAELSSERLLETFA